MQSNTPTNLVADLFHVRGIVAVITGGGSGLGLYAARALDANGARAVYIIGRRESTLSAAVGTAVNGTIKYLVADVTRKQDLESVAAHIRQEEGFVNLVFANAGIVGPLHNAALPSAASVTSIQAALMEPDMSHFNSTTMVNNTAVFYTAIAFLDLLEAGNRQKNLMQDSQVLVTSSAAGFSRHMAFSFAYATSKAAVNHLVKMLSTYFAQHGLRIRANLIAPGMYPSEMTMPVLKSLHTTNDCTDVANTFNETYVLSKDSTPSERSGSEADFAGAFLFLASRAGAYVNGETLITDGGRLCMLPSTY